nr:winged helix-turn-helix domain-containing protein [uncultured Lichenicoccus sp.]
MDTIRSFRFGAFRLDCSRRVLERAGSPVALSSRGFDILRVLIERREDVVTRAQIISLVWAGLAVEEHNLSVQMSKLRQALGEPGDGVIATIPGRGYQFVAPLEADAPAPEVPQNEATAAKPARGLSRYRLVLAMLAILLFAAPVAAIVTLHRAPPPRLSIVVMPFRDLSDHPGERYLADAISDDLTTDLAHLPGSMVIARETADAYLGHPVSASVIGHTLGVRYLLEGSLRVEEGSLHINAQLIDTLGGGHLWSERFDVSRAGLAETRARIVGRIAGALDLALDRVEAIRAERERAQDPDAVDLLFRARSRLDHDDTLAGFEAAEALLQRAVALRPDFAEAQAALGQTLLHKLRSTDDPETEPDQAQAHAAISRALALAPNDPDVMAALAELQFSDGHLGEAAGSAEIVLASDTNNIEARDVLATCASSEGHLDAAADALEEIMRLNPEGRRSRIRALRLGTFRLLQGHPAQAQGWLQRAIAGEPDPQPGAPDWGYPEEARLMLIAAAAMQGRVAQARSDYAHYSRIWTHRTTWRISALSTRAMSSLPGFRAMTDALQDAGMPAYADEHADDGVPAGAATLPDKSFVATPRNLTNAATVDTLDLETMIHAKTVGLILDLGPGVAVIQGAAWEGQGGNQDDASFVAASIHARPNVGRETPIVVMGDGPYGSVSYNAALKLVLAGYRHILWYRGGEEAWAEAKLPASDLRQ